MGGKADKAKAEEPAAVGELEPGELNQALDNLGEAVVANEQATTGTADAEGQHASAVRAMENITEELEIDTNEMVFDVRDFLLDTIKVRPKPWSATSQAEQRDVAAACENAAKAVVRKILEALVTRGQPAVRVLLTKVTLGSDVAIAGKVKTYDPEEENRAVEMLHSAVGKGRFVMLTIASVDDYAGQGRDAETEPDQTDFGFESGDATDEDDDE